MINDRQIKAEAFHYVPSAKRVTAMIVWSAGFGNNTRGSVSHCVPSHAFGANIAQNLWTLDAGGWSWISNQNVEMTMTLERCKSSSRHSEGTLEY